MARTSMAAAAHQTADTRSSRGHHARWALPGRNQRGESYFDDTGVRLGAAPTGIQPKDLLYPEQGYIVYIPGIPSPVRSHQAFSPDWYKGTLPPALLRQPYQFDAYSGAVAAPAIPHQRGYHQARPYRDRRFGNETNQYMNAQAPKPTWNGLAPQQRVLPSNGRMVAFIPGAISTR